MNKIVYGLVYNRRKRLNPEGEAPVQVVACLDGRKEFFSTGICLKPEQWDAEKHRVRRHPNADVLNGMLLGFLTRMEEKEQELRKQHKQLSLESLKQALAGGGHPASFIPFCRQEIEDATVKETTKRNHRTTLGLLQEFKKDVSFADLTFEFVTSFERFLHAKGYHVNTIAKHLKHLRRHVNAAINKDYMDVQKYAFRRYKIKTVENRHSHLTPEELERLEKLKLTGKLCRYRKILDAFLFCCYAGMRFSDFVRLRADSFVEIHRNTWLVYKTVKTGVVVRVPLYLLFQGKGVVLLKKYAKNLPGFFRLKDNSNVNKKLAVLARLAGLSEKISFHTARHTHATMLLYNGVNITTVQKLLGHKSVKTTQVYANIMDMTVVQDLEKQYTAGVPDRAETQSAGNLLCCRQRCLSMVLPVQSPPNP